MTAPLPIIPHLPSPALQSRSCLVYLWQKGWKWSGNLPKTGNGQVGLWTKTPQAPKLLTFLHCAPVLTIPGPPVSTGEWPPKAKGENSHAMDKALPASAGLPPPLGCWVAELLPKSIGEPLGPLVWTCLGFCAAPWGTLSLGPSWGYRSACPRWLDVLQATGHVSSRSYNACPLSSSG